MSITVAQDLVTYKVGQKQQREEIFLKYMALYVKTIKIKQYHYARYVTYEEMQSNATMAIHDSFKDLDLFIGDPSQINFHSLFNKNLTKIARRNVVENQPLTVEMKHGFNKTVSKSIKKDLYAGYKNSSCIDSETSLIDNNYYGSPEQEHSDRIEYILNRLLVTDDPCQSYHDMCDIYLLGKTYQDLSDEQGTSRQAIHQRVNLYMKKIGTIIQKELESEDARKGA